MKAIVFDRRPGSPVTLPPLFHLVPDSALTVSGQPVFLPDFPGVWEVKAALALRIGRLGKGIAAKFATRYIDALTLAVQAIPVTMERQLRAQCAPTSATWTFDGALTPGKWLPFDPAATSHQLSIGELNLTIDMADLRIDECVAAVSSLLTLKTGDVILPALCPPGVTVKPDDTLPCTLDGTGILTLKVK